MHARGSEQPRDGDIGAAILLRRRSVHRDERAGALAAIGQRNRRGERDAKIAAEARIE
jgi:hypothetical protein